MDVSDGFDCNNDVINYQSLNLKNSEYATPSGCSDMSAPSSPIESPYANYCGANSAMKSSTDSLADYLKNLEESLKFDSPERWLFLSSGLDENLSEAVLKPYPEILIEEESADEEDNDNEDAEEPEEEDEAEDSASIAHIEQPYRYLSDSENDDCVISDDDVISNRDKPPTFCKCEKIMEEAKNNCHTSTHPSLNLMSFEVSPRKLGSHVDANYSATQLSLPESVGSPGVKMHEENSDDGLANKIKRSVSSRFGGVSFRKFFHSRPKSTSMVSPTAPISVAPQSQYFRMRGNSHTTGVDKENDAPNGKGMREDCDVDVHENMNENVSISSCRDNSYSDAVLNAKKEIKCVATDLHPVFDVLSCDNIDKDCVAASARPCSEVGRLSEKEKMEAKMAKKRKMVVQELIDTEATYQRHLELAIRLFEDPLRSLGLLPDHIVSTIFGNVRQIICVNEELRRHLGTMDVGRAFLLIGPFLKVYSAYANNHEQALATLMEWDQKCSEFGKFRRKQEESEEMRGLKLNALLITPVQRVPRYKLMLEELLANTAFDDVDYVAVHEAACQVGAVAQHINEHIKQQDNFMKMLAIQKSLSCSVGPRILVPGRVFIKEGPLRKVCAKGDRSYERMFFLFSDMFMYAKPRLLDGGGYHSFICCCILPLHHCTVQRVLGHGKGQGSLFTVQCKQESLLLFSDQSTVNSWIIAISKAIEEQRLNRQTLRKTSSAKRPVRRSGIARLWKREQQADPLVSPAQHCAPEKSRKNSSKKSPGANGCAPLNCSSSTTPTSPLAFFSSRRMREKRTTEELDLLQGSKDKRAGRLHVNGKCLERNFENEERKKGGGLRKPTTPILQLWDQLGCLSPRARKHARAKEMLTDVAPIHRAEPPSTCSDNSSLQYPHLNNYS